MRIISRYVVSHQNKSVPLGRASPQVVFTHFCARERFVQRNERSEKLDKLDSYIRAHNLSQRAIAERIGINQATLSRYMSGKSTPNVHIANKIAIATGGAVSPSDWDQTDAN